MSGQRHEPRACDCADLGLLIVNFGNHQFGIGCKSAIFEGQRIPGDERVALTQEFEKDLLPRRRIQIQGETFLPAFGN